MKPGEIIRKFRLTQKPKKLTLKEMGRMIGYSHVQISNIERGIVEPSRDFIKAIEKVYALSWDTLYGQEKPKEFIARIEITNKDKNMIEATEGQNWPERFVPIPIAKDPISGGNPIEVREDPEGVAIIYRDWVRNPENFVAVWMRGISMEKTIPDGSLVGIDHAQKNIHELDGKMVAIRKNRDSTIKRLKIISKDLVLGLPDNPDSKDIMILAGEEIDTAIIGKVAWWWGRQK